MIRPVTVRELEEELHDARLDLLAIGKSGGHAIFSGVVERPITRRGLPQLARYPFTLHIWNVEEIAIEDDERIGMLIIHSVEYDSGKGQLCFEGAIPGRVVLRVTEPQAQLDMGELPVQVRRWWRWRTLDG